MNTLSMARKKKDLNPNQQLARAILEQYQPKSVEDMQDALKDIFGPMFEAMLQGEMNSHLGYSSNERGEKETLNRRNGYTKKTLKQRLEMSLLKFHVTVREPLNRPLCQKEKEMFPLSKIKFWLCMQKE